MPLTKNKEGKGAGGTKFWEILQVFLEVGFLFVICPFFYMYVAV